MIVILSIAALHRKVDFINMHFQAKRIN